MIVGSSGGVRCCWPSWQVISAFLLLLLRLAILLRVLVGPRLVIVLAKDNEPLPKRDVVLGVQVDEGALGQLASLCVVDGLLESHD